VSDDQANQSTLPSLQSIGHGPGVKHFKLDSHEFFLNFKMEVASHFVFHYRQFSLFEMATLTFEGFPTHL
jgi:hypothetical protein